MCSADVKLEFRNRQVLVIETENMNKTGSYVGVILESNPDEIEGITEHKILIIGKGDFDGCTLNVSTINRNTFDGLKERLAEELIEEMTDWRRPNATIA